jgi:hypothetical protein
MQSPSLAKMADDSSKVITKPQIIV